MVGEAPAHNEGTGRGFCALLMASRLVGPPLRGRMVPKRAMSEAENACGYVGARGGMLVLAAVTAWVHLTQQTQLTHFPN